MGEYSDIKSDGGLDPRNTADLRSADTLYESGWNSALEMAAFKLTHEFKHSFGQDTLASIAVYIKGMKK
jgi:hypothetical protein